MVGFYLDNFNSVSSVDADFIVVVVVVVVIFVVVVGCLIPKNEE